MKIQISHVIEFDVDAERKRISEGFEGRQKDDLMKTVDLFEQGKFSECATHIRTFAGKEDPELECREVEFINPLIWRYMVGWESFEAYTLKVVSQ